MRFLAPGVVALAIALAGCGTTPQADEASVEARTRPQAASESFPATSSCSALVDSPNQLTSANAVLDPASLTMTWNKSSQITGSAILYSAFVTNYDDEGNGPSYQVGIKFVDGLLASYFVADMANGQNSLLTSSVIDDTNSITGTFPRELLPGIDETAEWTAHLSVDGIDVSECDPLNPRPTVDASPSLEAAVAQGSLEPMTVNDLLCPYYLDVPDLRAIDPITNTPQVEAARDAIQAASDAIASIDPPTEHPEWAQSIELTSTSVWLAVRAANRWAAAAADGDKNTRDYATSAMDQWDSVTEECPSE